MASSKDNQQLDEDMLEALYGPQKEWHEDEPAYMGWKAEALIPRDYTPEHMKEAFILWNMPEEAYPDTPDVNYELTTTNPDAQEAGVIHVHLWSQAFRTYPKHTKHAHWSFWCSPQCEALGAVPNPLFKGSKVKATGYNHSSAVLAWGEAKMLAGWTDEVFAIDWHQQFRDEQDAIGVAKPILPAQVLNEFIFIEWPTVHEIVGGFHLVEDVQHSADIGVQAGPQWNPFGRGAQAQAPLPELHDIQAPASSTIGDDDPHTPTSEEPNATRCHQEPHLLVDGLQESGNHQDESGVDIDGWIADWCSERPGGLEMPGGQSEDVHDDRADWVLPTAFGPDSSLDAGGT